MDILTRHYNGVVIHSGRTKKMIKTMSLIKAENKKYDTEIMNTVM